MFSFHQIFYENIVLLYFLLTIRQKQADTQWNSLNPTCIHTHQKYIFECIFTDLCKVYDLQKYIYPKSTSYIRHLSKYYI